MWQHVTNESMNKSVRKRSKVSRFADLKWNEGSFLWASSAAKKMPLTAMEQSEIVWREAKFQFWRCLDICSSFWSCFRSYFWSLRIFRSLGASPQWVIFFGRGFPCYCFSEFCSGMLLPSNQSSQHRRQVWGCFAELPKSHQLAWQKQKSEEFWSRQKEWEGKSFPCKSEWTQPHRAQDKQMERVTRRCFMTDKLPMNWCELMWIECAPLPLS